MEQTQEIQKHRIQMMAEKERREREQQEANQAMLQNKREHDLKVHRIKNSTSVNFNIYFKFLSQFHQAQQEKAQRAYQEAKELQQFLRNQVAEKEKQQKAEKREEKEMNSCNRHLMEVGLLYEGIHAMILYLSLNVHAYVHRWSRDSSQSMLTECCQWPEHEELPHSL